MIATQHAGRSARTVSHSELVLSARRRLDGLTDRYGVDSPQVKSAMARWGALLKTRTHADDLTALVDATFEPVAQ